ncbi:MAG: hypothetical protein IJ309_03425 [Clostridia bacterium]|nr:hypothetical protein [Clostridia bacterium]
MKKNNVFKLRLSEDIAKKLAYVSMAEGMSIQNELSAMIRQKIAYFERVKGNIPKGQLNNVEMNEFESDEE